MKKTLTLGEIIENDGVVFDFSYPYYTQDFKNSFEENFIDHFYFDEIGLETFAKFKHRLKTKLKIIMPNYEKILATQDLEQRIMDNYDITETYARTHKNNATQTSETKGKAINKNVSLENDTPKTNQIDITSNSYISNISKNDGNIENEQNGKNISIGDSIENWTRKMTGNIGVATDSDAIISYWKSLRRIQEEIFLECDTLFMGVFN